MLYLGLDVHSKWMTVKGFDPETGESVELKKVSNEEACLHDTFRGFAGPLRGVMESGTNSWSVYRILERYFEELMVVDPATVWGKEIRRGAKTDRRDAFKLAQKMHKGDLTPLYVPDVETQDKRALGRAKVNASRRVTKLVNEIGAVLRSWGIIVHCSLLSEEGQALIERSRAKLPEFSLFVLEGLLEQLKLARETEDRLEQLVDTTAAKDETCKLLMSIPDVGPITALVVRAEIGDVSRFHSAEALVNYCGLGPTVDQSSDRTYYGKLNKACNRFLKYVLVLRAQGIARSKKENPMRDTYWRIVFKGKNHAKIAVSRQLTRVIYRMLKDKTPWKASEITKRRAMSARAVM